MTSTLISSATSYAAYTDMLNRFDANVLLQLCSDTGTRVTTTGQLGSNARMTAALKAASGRLEAACLMGERYTPADLTLLAGTNSGEFLLDIVCGIAMCWLYDVRPEPGRTTYPLMTQALEALDALTAGKLIFGLLEPMEAGHLKSVIEQPADVYARHGNLTIAQRFFGEHAATRWQWPGP